MHKPRDFTRLTQEDDAGRLMPDTRYGVQDTRYMMSDIGLTCIVFYMRSSQIGLEDAV